MKSAWASRAVRRIVTYFSMTTAIATRTFGSRPIKRRRPTSARLAVVAACISATILLTPGAAHADSKGCTPLGKPVGDVHGVPAPTGFVCIHVSSEKSGVFDYLHEGGSGARISYVKAEFGGASVNNWIFRITFFNRHNKMIEQHKSRYHSGTSMLGWFNIYPHKKFPDGRVCASLEENGVAYPGACESIHG
jgi:hypothetical protein